MDGVHDLGGTDGMGAIDHTSTEPTFHADWERVVFAMVLVTMARRHFTMDEFRHAIERMDPVHYLDSSYYEHWLAGLETALVEGDVLSPAAIADRAAAFADDDAAVPSREDPELAATMRSIVASGGSPRRGDGDPAFGVGDAVRVRNVHPEGHTRCPQYVRGAPGTVESVHGAHVLPDARAHGEGDRVEPLYNVRFDGAALWGPDAEANTAVSVDLWESYLVSDGDG